MAIDRDRYEQFQRDLLALAGRLRPEEYYATVRAKLLDYLARNEVDPEDTSELQAVVRRIFGEGFEPFVGRIFAAYAETLDIVNEHYQDLGVEITRDFQTVRAIELANAADLGDFKDAAVRHITRSVREGILQHETERQLQQRIAQAGGKVRAYSRAIAQTQIKVVGRTAKAEKARIAEVEYYEYVGLTRDTNRPFCRALIGTTHHVDTIREMRNGNKEPVLYNCGGWRCIHDWEPDPFAKEGTPGRLYQIGGIAVFTDDTGRKRFSQAENEQHYAQLADPAAFVERCRTVDLTDERISKIRRDHGDTYASEKEIVRRVQEARSNPDALYYQFHRGKSTIVFENGPDFVFATDGGVNTMFAPMDKERYQLEVVQYWKRI